MVQRLWSLKVGWIRHKFFWKISTSDEHNFWLEQDIDLILFLLNQKFTKLYNDHLNMYISWNRFSRNFDMDAHNKERQFDYFDKRFCTKSGVYQCEICMFKSPYKGNLKRHHMCLHTGQKRYQCETCGYTTPYNYLLQDHRRTHLPERPFECQHCDNRYRTKKSLNKHMVVHSGTVYQCAICEHNTPYKQALQKHLRTHTKERPFEGQHCDKRFTQSGTNTKDKPFQYPQWIPMDTKERPFACQHCDWRFTNFSSLTIHMRTHTKERPFACQHCAWRFTNYSSLFIHMRRHIAEKPYQCETAHKQVMQDHLRTHLPINTPQFDRTYEFNFVEVKEEDL